MKPALSSGPTHGSLRSATQAVEATCGHARQFSGVFDRSLVPMMTVDSKRRIVAANCATRLLLRLSLAEMRERHLNDFTPPHMQRLLEEACLGLVHRGSVAGHGAISLLDASQLRIVYCAIANALPGQHVIVFMPANWPENELGVIEESPIPASSAPLSPREREVLTMISAGADLRQVSDELS